MDYKEKVIALLNSQELSKEQKEKLEDAFPELKESEDERMVKFIKKQLFNIKKTITENYELDAKLTKAIDWLEKQGEHAKFRDSIQVGDKVTRNQDGVLVNQSQLKRVAKKDEKQGEQKQELLTKEKALKNSPFVEQKSADEVEPKFKVGDIIKPKCYNETHSIKAMGERYYILDVDIKIPFRDEDEWELVEHKNAWSEEDEQMYIATIYALAGFRGNEVKLDWLKSLKERYTWKPTMEQLTVLSKAIELRPLCESDGTILMSLYYDLKKLMEE